MRKMDEDLITFGERSSSFRGSAALNQRSQSQGNNANRTSQGGNNSDDEDEDAKYN